MQARRTIVLAMAGLGLVGCHAQPPTVLSGKVTADNAFYVYLATHPSDRGTLIASGDAWGTTYELKPVRLAPGRTYYLHVEAINYGDQGALVGDFRLSGARFHFANGGQKVVTNTRDWLGGFNSANSSVSPQPWVTPSGPVFSQGANGVGPWGQVAGVDPGAQWIWPSDVKSAPNGPTGACPQCTVDFSVTIAPAG